MIIEFPHFDLPFRFDGNQLATVEQGTESDIRTKVLTLVSCPLGHRDELPEFGWPQNLFDATPLGTSQHQALLDEWVPDARAVLTESGSTLDEALRRISITIAPEGL